MSRRQRLRRHHLKKYAANVIGGTSGIDKHYFREAAMRAQITDTIFRDHLPNVDFIQKSQIHGHICLLNTVYHKLYMFWNEDYSRFYFVRKDRDVALTSISYPSRERAMRAFTLQKIVYKYPK